MLRMLRVLPKGLLRGRRGQYSPWNVRGKNADRHEPTSAEQLYYPFKVKCDRTGMDLIRSSRSAGHADLI